MSKARVNSNWKFIPTPGHTSVVSLVSLTVSVSVSVPVSVFVFAFVLGFGSTSFAQSVNEKANEKPVNSKKSTVTTTITTTVSEGAGDDDTSKTNETVLTATFGTKSTSGSSGLAGCKTEELAKTLIKELKSDCSAWLKDRKSDLKDKYLTGSCQESCTDCSMGLRRCVVDGLVHYTSK